MSDHLTADQAKQLKKEINARITKMHGARYARGDLSHLVEAPATIRCAGATMSAQWVRFIAPAKAELAVKSGRS
jgi:hypothetical protein